MARLPRLNLPDIAQHIIQRGNNQQACFFDEQDRQTYLDKLAEYGQKYHVAIHAYCLMSNHVHLLLTPEQGNGASRLMQSLGRYYVRYINSKYQRSGTLWEGRFKSTLVDTEYYLLTVSRYIELNPVRADLVTHPDDYPYSSYANNALGKPSHFITPSVCYQALAKTDKGRQSVYKTLFKHPLTQHTLDEIRHATNKSWVLGSEAFKIRIEKQTGRRASPSLRGGDRKSAQYKKNKQQLSQN